MPQSSGPNILDCLIMKTDYVTPKRRQLFTSRKGVTSQKACSIQICEVVTITAMKNDVFCDVTPCRVAEFDLHFVGTPRPLKH